MTPTELAKLISGALQRRKYPQIVLAHPVGGFDMHPITHKRAETYKKDPSFIGVFSRKSRYERIRKVITGLKNKRTI